jgi:outer membrane lipoprotein SlyB
LKIIQLFIPYDGNGIGKFTGDAIRKITGELGATMAHAVSGAFRGDTAFLRAAPGGEYGFKNIDFDSSRVVPAADENRPASISVCYYIAY